MDSLSLFQFSYLLTAETAGDGFEETAASQLGIKLQYLIV